VFIFYIKYHFTWLTKRAIPVRKAAIKSLLVILRKIPLQKVRYTYFNKLLDFSMDKNCYKRAFFVDICNMVMELYSKNFFKNYFYQSLIQLSNDPVINVRICFSRMLVDLKKLWKFQHDRDKLDNLEKIAKNLLHDKDKDVYELAQKVILIL
jgi:serine/threonine-protein phosphatase 4 regulatory subunit 4